MNYFPMERNRYFYGKLLTVRDFEAEQNYAINKRCLLNRVLQGAGVVCGLGVTVDNDSTLIIGSGLALDYQGREIVVERPLLRKLQMIEGSEKLQDSSDAWLSIEYSEEQVEPVSAAGNAPGSSQYNMVREGFALRLSEEQPDYVSILNAAGMENVNVLYHDRELTLVLCAPSCVCGGSEFNVSVLVVKNSQTPPVQFSLEGRNSFVSNAEQMLSIRFNESPEEKRMIYFVDFPVHTQSISGIKASLLPGGGELNVEMGSHHYCNQISMDVPVNLVKDEREERVYYQTIDSLEKQTSGASVPIYLAKVELIHSAGGTFINSVTSLPLEQKVQPKTAASGEAGSEGGDLSVTTSVRGLEYWQKPEVSASVNKSSGAVHFDFGIPSPEQYDYTVSHGSVDIPLPGGNRVNAHYYSDEIPYGLGPGAVDVRLTIEFTDDSNTTALLVGNSEVFKKDKDVPRAEAAAILYPERGTMKIGIWLHDDIRENMLRVHYFASRPSMDSSVMASKRWVSVTISPEMARVGRGEQVRLKAMVVGSEEKGVTWKVKDSNGGDIDANGFYTAPQMQGTYEVEAVSKADETAKASAFVIVD